MRSVVLKTMIAGGLFAGLSYQQATAAAPASPQGIITMRTYPGDQRADIRAGKASPDGLFYPKRMEGPYNNFPDDDPGDDDAVPVDERDTYSTELVGYFYPPTTGKIQFALSTDDPGALYFSTDDDPAKSVLIATEPTWNGKRAFAAEARRTRVNDGTLPADRLQNQSPFIDVVAGKAYFIQSISNEGGGGDNNAVAFRYQADAEFADGDKPILGKFLSTIDRTELALPYVSGFSGNPDGPSWLVHDGSDPGAKQLDAASVKVTVDGATVAATVTKSGPVSSVVATVPFLAPKSTHTAKLEFTGGSSEKTFTVIDYKSLTPDMKVTADTTKPGFTVQMTQVDGNTENTLSRTEAQLAGTLKDVDGNVLPNVADLSGAGADGRFVIDGGINWNQDDPDVNGNFQGGSNPIPGIPGSSGSTDGIAAEIVTYLDLPKGTITMGVNSDDGFETTAGNIKDVLSRVRLGVFDGGRGAADTIFSFVVQEAGIYSFRTIWEEGGGGANIEWFTVNGGTKVLINDKAAAGALKGYRALAAGAIQPAYVKSVSPSVGQTEVKTTASIDVALADASTQVDAATVKLSVNGQPTTATATKSGGNTTLSYKPANGLDTSTPYTAELTWKDTAGKSEIRTWSFSTTILGPDTLFIEAEDFNFDQGKHLTANGQSGMAGKYPGGDYQDLGTDADVDIDYFNAGGNAGQAYRPGTGVAAGKKNAHLDGLPRGTFDVEANHVVGWNDPGDWQNYTRTFPEPAKKYDVYARMSSGGSPINQEISKVTSDPTKPGQTLQHLGQIKPGRATAAWDILETFRAIDDNGDPLVLELGGVTTLRLTTVPGSNLDIDWLAFIPSKQGSTTVGPLKVSFASGQVKIEWTGGTLQSTTALPGGWADVAGASSPYSTPPTGATRYFRTRQ